MNLQEFIRNPLLKNVKKQGNGYIDSCPAHGDDNPSLSIGSGADGKILLRCHTGCTTEAIVWALNLEMKDLYPVPQEPRQEIRRHYYQNGYKAIFNTAPRAMWVTVGKDGKTTYKKPQGTLLYNIGAFNTLENNLIFIAEGEKDVDTLVKLGYPCVCSPDGAGKGKWNKKANEYFTGKNVVIFEDNDDVGREFAKETADSLLSAAESVKILDLRKVWPSIPNHGDISDYMAQGLDFSAVLKHMNTLPLYTPSNTAKEQIALEKITSAELSKMIIQPVKWCVKELLPQGFSLLVAPSKYGKSWFALDLALSVASGTSFLGFETVKSEVVYLALEDSYRRLKERQSLILKDTPPPTGLFFAVRAQTLDNGLVSQIDEHIKSHKDTGLIIVDVLQRVRSTKVNGSMSAYAIDYADMGALKEIADKHDITILCVHHDRKMKDKEDPFNQISGTSAIMGSADTIFLITRASRKDDKAVLMMTGRDVESQDYVMSLDLKNTYKWHRVETVEEEAYNAEFEEYNNNPVVKTIKGLLAISAGGIEVTAGEIQDHMPLYANTMWNDKKIGVTIPKLKSNLYNYDEILYYKTPRVKKRTHRFYKKGYVFPFEMAT